ncbi:Phosphotransferase enzyme family protein [Actinoplanes derwentensis]|uniref:Phosphotransferase enzyme family protein n=1 Tax=Actinoplanes derwentensis TaxID=113562 RepID=A0A1H2CVD2_9ACTN|nr:Phosphotransferase enzyme family protein [Actinoplanes derwentensis]
MHEGGIPTAEAIPDRSGEFLHIGRGPAVSVWSFVEGHNGANVTLDGNTLEGAGTLLGRAHRRLADWPGPVSHSGGRWCDLPRLRDAMTDMKIRLHGAGHLSGALRSRANEVLNWREQRLNLVAETLRNMPVPAIQVLHGDCTERNVIFRSRIGPALIDFRAPYRWPIWWELARIGCAVPAILSGDAHIDALAQFLIAYRESNDEIPVADLMAVAQAARCYTTASVTPFQDLVAPGPVMSMPTLTDYIEQRHAAVSALWNRADAYDEKLREALR